MKVVLKIGLLDLEDFIAEALERRGYQVTAVTLGEALGAFETGLPLEIEADPVPYVAPPPPVEAPMPRSKKPSETPPVTVASDDDAPAPAVPKINFYGPEDDPEAVSNFNLTKKHIDPDDEAFDELKATLAANEALIKEKEAKDLAGMAGSGTKSRARGKA